MSPVSALYITTTTAQMYTRHVAHRSNVRTFGTEYAPWPIVTLVLYRRNSVRRAETRARDDDDTCINARGGSLLRVHRPVARDSQRANRLYRPTPHRRFGILPSVNCTDFTDIHRMS